MKWIKKLQNGAALEKRIMTECTEEINKTNLSVLRYLLVGNFLFVAITPLLFSRVPDVMQNFSLFRFSYFAFMLILAVLFILACRYPTMRSQPMIYTVYFICTVYAVVSCSLASPARIDVYILALIFSMSVLFVDYSWRVCIINIAFVFGYLIVALNFKDSHLILEETLNVFSFLILGLTIGIITRHHAMQNYSAKLMLNQYAYFDQLTRLPNRRQLYADFEESAGAVAEEKRIRVIGILDIDSFKKFNDCYGHIEGDRCLSAISELFNREAREQGIRFYRFGGEEFLLTFYNQSVDEARRLCRKLCRDIEGLQIQHESSPYGVITVSIGLAPVAEDSRQYEKVLSLADTAMYYVKQHGKNNVTVYSEDLVVPTDAITK